MLPARTTPARAGAASPSRAPARRANSAAAGPSAPPRTISSASVSPSAESRELTSRRGRSAVRSGEPGSRKAAMVSSQTARRRSSGIAARARKPCAARWSARSASSCGAKRPRRAPAASTGWSRGGERRGNAAIGEQGSRRHGQVANAWMSPIGWKGVPRVLPQCSSPAELRVSFTSICTSTSVRPPA